MATFLVITLFAAIPITALILLLYYQIKESYSRDDLPLYIFEILLIVGMSIGSLISLFC